MEQEKRNRRASTRFSPPQSSTNSSPSRRSLSSSRASSKPSTSKDAKKYEVEEILAKRIVGKYVQYFVKWKGYDKRFNSWIPKENCGECEWIIERFEENYYPKTPTQALSTTSSSVSKPSTPKSTTRMRSGISFSTSYSPTPPQPANQALSGSSFAISTPPTRKRSRTSFSTSLHNLQLKSPTPSTPKRSRSSFGSPLFPQIPKLPYSSPYPFPRHSSFSQSLNEQNTSALHSLDLNQNVVYSAPEENGILLEPDQADLIPYANEGALIPYENQGALISYANEGALIPYANQNPFLYVPEDQNALNLAPDENIVLPDPNENVINPVQPAPQRVKKSVHFDEPLKVTTKEYDKYEFDNDEYKKEDEVDFNDRLDYDEEQDETDFGDETESEED
uniref:Chromo domain-containing protein n=1 Tax=Panagrolaimus sp. ES5 TaxID=591445 RepID=A0AC34FNB0_9BILA